MKTYPQPVLDMLNSGHIRFGYLLTLKFNTTMYLSGLGFDVSFNGNNHVASPIFQGMEEFTRRADMSVTEMQLSFSLADQTITAVVLGQEYYNKAVIIDRVFLDENNQVIHSERVWKGKITSYSDDQDQGVVNLTTSGFWAEFEASNAWRTTLSSQQKRFAGDKSFKYAAKASETVYWGGKATGGGFGTHGINDGGIGTTGSTQRH